MADPKSKSVEAFAVFFDDVRMEIGNKLSLMGLHGPIVQLNPASGAIIDRMAVFLTVRWPIMHQPKTIAFKLNVPGQITEYADLPAEAMQAAANVQEHSVATTIYTAFQLRFPPLRVGDSLTALLKVDGSEMKIGSLEITPMP